LIADGEDPNQSDSDPIKQLTPDVLEHRYGGLCFDHLHYAYKDGHRFGDTPLM
jgi:hypothetical protein